MFEGQPKSLYALALANTGERFGYYTMIAVFALFLRGNFGLEPGTAGAIYSTFLGLVYFLPLVGGLMADKFGYGKMVTTGIMIMFIGYLCLAIPLGTSTVAFSSMLAALLLISLGTGLFKGNLQVMVGNLYDAQGMESKRDSGFSIFYMAINIGALFAPTAAVKIHDWGIKSLHMDPNSAYHLAFAVACVSLILSIAIYYAFRPGFKHLEGSTKKKEEKAGATTVEELSPAETKERIIALCLVFAVVIFFWMAFHQNGLTLTYFADEFVQPTAEGVQSMVFDVINLFMVIIIVYAGFAFFGAKTGKARGISTLVILAALAVIAYKYSCISGSVAVSAPIFQQFNPFYVVALTPVSMAIFGALARKGKEPSAPRKIAYGMLIAGCGFLVMLLASMGLNSPDAQKAAAEGAKTFASPNWLIGTYLVLTFGELLLSPMGISFVSKVAPPKYKGAMMGGWFVATALGNLLVSVGGFLWGKLPLTVVWSVFIILCVLSALFMFSVMKKLEKVAK